MAVIMLIVLIYCLVGMAVLETTRLYWAWWVNPVSISQVIFWPLVLLVSIFDRD